MRYVFDTVLSPPFRDSTDGNDYVCESISSWRVCDNSKSGIIQSTSVHMPSILYCLSDGETLVNYNPVKIVNNRKFTCNK